MRKSGFDLPLNHLQIGSWGITLFNLLMSAVIYMPTLPKGGKVRFK